MPGGSVVSTGEMYLKSSSTLAEQQALTLAPCMQGCARMQRCRDIDVCVVRIQQGVVVLSKPTGSTRIEDCRCMPGGSA
jgi:hypothetical protein